MKNHRTSYKTQNCCVMTVEILKNPPLRNIAAYIYSEISSLFQRNTDRICVFNINIFEYKIAFRVDTEMHI